MQKFFCEIFCEIFLWDFLWNFFVKIFVTIFTMKKISKIFVTNFLHIVFWKNLLWKNFMHSVGTNPC